jgi:fibronectin-binding autotransporter adhesin
MPVAGIHGKSCFNQPLRMKKIQLQSLHLSASVKLLVIATVLISTAKIARAQANTELWMGTNNVSATTNWSDNLNWSNLSGTGGPGPNGNDVVFGDGAAASAAGVVDSVVDNNSLNPSSLTFTNNSSTGNFHTVLIPAGVNLTNANQLIVGMRLDTSDFYPTTVGIVGGGTLVQNGTPLQVDASGSSAASGSGKTATLDLSGLTNFIYANTNAGSTLTVAGTSSGSEARAGGLLNLAAGSNYINVNNLNVALGTGNSGPGGTLNLGTGTNIINVANINMGAGKINNARMQFFDVIGGLRIRGLSGDDSDGNVTVVLGNRSNSGTGTPTGIMDFTGGHPIDIKVNTVTLAKSNQTGAGAGGISFDTGTFDATTINMGITSNSGAASGTNNVNGGTLIAGDMSMANQSSSGLGTGVLNINGPGAVIISNSIVKTTVAGQGIITMNGGTLTVGANSGTPAAPIDSFSVADSTLTLPASLAGSAHVTSLTAGGTANTINVSSMPNFFSYPAQYPIISYASALGDNSTFKLGTLPGTFTGYISNNVGNLSIDVVITNGPAKAPLKSISWNGTPTGDWTTNTGVLNWVTNGVSVNYNPGDTVTFNDSLAGTTNVNITQPLTPTDVTVNNSLSNYVFTGVGKIGGLTGLTKTGSGTLVLDNSGSNDFTGNVSIGAGGTLQVGNNDVNGNLPMATSWDDEGTLAFDRTDNLLIPTVISGAGALAQNGSGTLSLNATETYTGNTLINNGTLAVVGNGYISSSAGVFARNGTFDISAATPSTFLNGVGLSNGTLIVGTNNVTINALSATNSTITLVANLFGPSIGVTTLTTGGATNYINITGIANGGTTPAVVPIISYGTANFASGFNFAETNFPNAYVTNDTAAHTVDLVLTAAPYLVTWNGGSGTDNNWSDSNNWAGVTIFPSDSLTFDGSTRLNPINDTAAGTTYSNITFNPGASSFTLGGNPITITGTIANDSPTPQTINLGLDFNSNASLNGASAPLIIANGLTNAQSGSGSTMLTLAGTGILTNLLGSSTAASGANAFVENDFNGNWTLFDNALSAAMTVPWAFEINAGTFNFGSASSAPTVISTSPQGFPSDDQVGANGGTATLNFSNGVFTTSSRLNTGASTGSSGTINQYGGTINIANQFQGANGSSTSISAVNLYGGTMNIGISPTTTNFGPFYVASRGTSTLLVTNSAVLNCGTLDVSRAINNGIAGTVSLGGGVIVANNVSAATANSGSGNTASTATFNFNGGTLRARTDNAAFFQGHTKAPIIDVNAIVQVGGAIIDSDVYNIGFLEPLVTDPNLGGLPDGGLKKLGIGTLRLAGTNTYTGKTLVAGGTLLVDGVQGPSLVIVSNNATLGGSGVIGSNVTVNAGGTLSPGDNAVGTLTVAGNVSLGGTTTMEIDKVAGTNDLLLATNTTPSTITYGGTLNLVTVGGTLAPGDTFKLFSANNYSGSFTAINSPGVTWNTSNLNVDGTLAVVSVAPTGPTTNASITSVSLVDNNIVIHGTNNNVPNNTMHYEVLASTNLAVPLSNWTVLATNLSYTAEGTFDYTNPIVPGTPQQFLDVKAMP